MSQFEFLKTEFSAVFSHASRAEGAALVDPRSACFYARLSLEVVVNWLYNNDGVLREPYEGTLAARIYEPTFRRLVGEPIVTKARIIKDLGNNAAHETKPVPQTDAVTSIRELFHITYWLARTYGRQARPNPALAFSPEMLPQIKQISVASLTQLQEAARYFADAVRARDEALAASAASEDERAKLEAELAAVRAEIVAIKAANSVVADTHDYNEAATRDAFIDLLLREAGWALDKDEDREFEVSGMPNSKGTGFVDYVLWGDDAKPLGLVEAKRTKRDPRVGQQQAKLYADCLETEFAQRPIIFYSNGYEHWIWDDVNAPPRAVQGFLTRDELQLVVQRRTIRKSIVFEEIDKKIVERFYQERAIRRIAESFERDHLRKALIVMATGAGKTRLAVALSDLLMRANWGKRVLFLADRVALVKQAVNAFKTFLPSSSPVNLVKEKDGQGRVFVSTYPTMMGLIEELTENGARRFGSGYFDLIFIDEAHRSVFRKYKAIFEYFDALLVGLTATPKDEVDRDTYRLFDLQRGVPTDAYGLEEAVYDKWLVPPKPVSVPLKIPQEGLHYADLTDEEKEKWDELEWSEDGSVPDRVESAAINKWLFNDDTVDKVLEHLMRHGLKVDSGDRLGKTIIFAKNHDHAQFIAQRFDVSYPHLKGVFARVIDFKTEYRESLLDDFMNPGKPPHIAISVDMLDTGIDVPEIINLVFFKTIRSKTKFWQMIGRGTRLRPDLFGPGVNKEYFYVFDFCRNFEYFNQNLPVTDPVIADSISKQVFRSRVELVGEIYQVDRQGQTDKALQGLWHDTADRLREEVAGMNVVNFLVRPKRRFVEKYAKPEPWDHPDLESRTELIQEVAGLPSEITDGDIEAKRFDLLLLKAQLALLQNGKQFAGLRKRIVEIAGLLESLSNIPMVASELEIIQEIQTDGYWEDVTAPMLEAARKRLRGLIKLLEYERRPLVFSDFEDEIGSGRELEFAGITPGLDLARFKAKVNQYLMEHQDHIAILKLRRNEPLTPTDLGELERMFIELGIDNRENIERLCSGENIGVFVRSLVGLDRGAAKEAFSAFLQDRNLTVSQLDFVNMIIDHLTARGIIEPALLYASPFTDMDPLGVAGVFAEREVLQIVSILEDIRKRAAA